MPNRSELIEVPRMFNRITLVFCLLLFVFAGMQAQAPKKIKFKKDLHYIYFFQKGAKADVIVPGKSDEFYLLVPDSVKPHILIASENAELILQKNDSLVICKYLPGLRYEHYYQIVEEFVPESYRFKVGVNGAAVAPREKILIQFFDKRSGKLMFENWFIAKQ
jgi:hypothetical protein